MKIKSAFALSALLVCFLFPWAAAQVTVVKQDGSKIYLDTSEYNRQISVGTSFKIIVSQEKLVNPKTGKELGLINHYSPSGKIIEVQPLYAVGELPQAGKYTAGQEVVLETQTIAVTTAAPATQAADASLPSAPAQTLPARKMETYPSVEREIISAVKTDLTPFPGEEIAALDSKGNVILYVLEGNNLQEKVTHKLNTNAKPVGLSAGDVMHTGYAQLFVTVYQDNDARISTLVFDLQNQAFTLIDTLPYFVQTLGCDENQKVYAQKPFIGGSRPGNAHELLYKNGRFELAKKDFATRGNWLTGIARYPIENADTENFLYTAYNGILRLRLKNGKYAESPDVFGTAPNRIRYKQNIIAFYPAVQVFGPKGKATIAALQNTTKLGILSEQFGQYNGGKLHFLHYQDGTLKIDETVTLSGFAYDSACTARGILIPQVLPSGQTILTEIYR